MTDLPQKTVKAIRAARAAGIAWKQIQKQFSISYETARAAIDGNYVSDRSAAERARRRNDWKGKHHKPGPRPSVPSERVEALRAWLDHPDDRTLTGRLLGDPGHGRSALDRKRTE